MSAEEVDLKRGIEYADVRIWATMIEMPEGRRRLHLHPSDGLLGASQRRDDSTTLLSAEDQGWRAQDSDSGRTGSGASRVETSMSGDG